MQPQQTNQNDAHEPPCGDCSTVQECGEPDCTHEAKQAAYAAKRMAWTDIVGRVYK